MRKLIAAVTIAASFAVVPAANAAEEVYLRADGLTGESQVQGQSGYIAVGSFNWGSENKAAIGSATGGAGVGKATFKELTIEKTVDATSPLFFQRMASGQHFKSMELVVRKAGAPSGTPYLRYHFQTTYVTGADVSGGTGEESTKETIRFAFGAASQDFRGQGPTGQPLAPVFAGWNIMKNLAVGSYPAFGTPAL